MKSQPLVVSRNPNDPGTKSRIFQANRITNASYNYSLLQEKIFCYIMYALKGHIDKVMNGANVLQLDIFRAPDSNNIAIIVPLKYIATPAQYKDVKKAAFDMMSRVIRMRGKDLKNRDTIEFTGLFSSIVMTEERSGTLQVMIRRDVAEMLIDIPRNDAGRPVQYTGFILEVALKARNKYTPRMYKFISSWKERGGVYVSLDELRNMLSMGDKYTDYNDFKRSVLLPAQEELKQHADCWYNVSDMEEVKEGKKVIGLRFKIITVDRDKQRELLLHNLYNDLLPRLELTKTHIDLLRPTLDRADVHDVRQKAAELYIYINENYRSINNPAAYAMTALQNTFGHD
jgi:hypothetical protein